MPHNISTANRAFSLMEMAVCVALMGLIASIALTINTSTATVKCYQSTQHQLTKIRAALDQFAAQNEYLPLPAPRAVGVENPAYGRAAPLGAVTSVAGISYGALPFQTLNLSQSYASDCWGNKFTYAVTTSLTTHAGYKNVSNEGAIDVRSAAANTILSKGAYAVISHGANGIGSVKNNYTDASGNPKWCTFMAASLDKENCDANNATVVAAEFNDGKDAGTNLFDDIVIYRSKAQTMVNGLCAATANTCLAGQAINYVVNACGTDTWTCAGVNGGTSDTTCNAPNTSCPPPSPTPPSPPPPPPCKAGPWACMACGNPFPGFQYCSTQAVMQANGTFTGCTGDYFPCSCPHTGNCEGSDFVVRDCNSAEWGRVAGGCL